MAQIENARRIYRNATAMLANAALDKDSREYYSAVAASALSLILIG